MKTPRTILGSALVPLVMMTAPAASLGQSEEAASSLAEGYQADVAEQEGAVYGRLRFLEGEATLRRDDEVTADLLPNDPIVPGDVLTTRPGSRLEIQLADGSVVRLDEASELVLMSLADSSSQIENATILQLGAGSLIVRATDMDSNEKRFQIDTDTASIFLLSDGLFRVDVREDGTTWVSSRRGAAEVMSEEVSTIVRSGERSTVRPGRIPTDPVVFNTRLSDDFDGWSTGRDDALVRRARPDVDEEPAGLPEPIEPYAGELSYYGNWYHNPSYGWIWRPVGLVSDWQPYLYGRWVPSRSGLVWVSYEPWGWAPFHYGRWEFLVGTGWVWIPGYVFSGAHVAWGFAPGGYLGWCARGYYDYPVRFGYGIHHDPWVYVQVNNIFVHRVNTVVVREVAVIKEIEKRRVVVAGRPKLDHRRVKENPRVVEEIYTHAKNRPEFRLADPAPGARPMPFREHERQRLVKMNERRMKSDQKDAVPVVRGRSGRPAAVAPSERRVTVPPAGSHPRRAPQEAAPGRTPGRGTEPRTEPKQKEKEKDAPGAAGRQGGAPGAGSGSGSPPARRATVQPGRVPQTQTPGQTPPSRRNPRLREDDAPAQAPGQAPPSHGNPRLREDRAPEHVIPRIIPRPRTQDQEKGAGRPPQAAPRQPQSSPPPRATPPPRSQGNQGSGKDKKASDKGGNGKHKN